MLVNFIDRSGEQKRWHPLCVESGKCVERGGADRCLVGILVPRLQSDMILWVYEYVHETWDVPDYRLLYHEPKRFKFQRGLALGNAVVLIQKVEKYYRGGVGDTYPPRDVILPWLREVMRWRS